MSIKLLAEHHLEFLSLKGGCKGSSDSTHVKMPHCWKSHVAAHMCFVLSIILSCLLLAALWSPATSLLSCMICFLMILSLSHMVSCGRCGI